MICGTKEGMPASQNTAMKSAVLLGSGRGHEDHCALSWGHLTR